MGNDWSGQPTDLEAMKRFQGMSPGQVKLIKEKFELMADEDLTIDRDGFKQLMKLKDNELDKLFACFDLQSDNRIDSHEFVCALTLLSQCTLYEKVGILFSLYDFDHNKTITKNELVILIKTTMTALGAMSLRGEYSIIEAEKQAENLLNKYDTNNDASISLQEFQSFVSRDQDILKMLLSYGLISLEDLRQDFGGQESIPDPDSDLERETSRKELAYDSKREKRKFGIEHVNDEEEDVKFQTYEQFQQHKKNTGDSWKSQVKNGAPPDWKPGKADQNAPATQLDLDYIYGFRCFDSRNNIKVLQKDQPEIVYHAAAVGITLDTQRNSQRFFFEHTDDITCIDVFDRTIATGQVGNVPTICIWETGEPSKATFKGILKQGVNNLAFSNDGKKLAAVGMDPDHSIVIYDVEKAQAQRGLLIKDNYVIATGRGPKSFVFDIKFDKVDKNLMLACKNEVYFATFEQGIVKLIKGTWESKTCPFQSVLSIGLVEMGLVTGMYYGQLLIWKSNRATQSIEAHKGAVLAIHTKQEGIITGSKDGMVIVWEAGMKIKDKIVIQTLNLKIVNTKICSVTALNDIIYVGTRGSDIIEIAANKYKVLMKGHSQGNLRGLTIHPKQQVFFTIGEDNILACWSIKDKKLMNYKKLDFPSCAIHISYDANYLACGSLNGTVLIIDPKTLQPTFNFKDRDAEVSCIKFSNDNDMLAVGHHAPSCDVILYSVRNHFKKLCVLRGSPARVITIDFSPNNRILQINDWSQQVLYYELTLDNNAKVQPDGPYKYKDIQWQNYTAIYGWHVQGVWPHHSSGTDVNAVDKALKNGILVSADDFSSIKVFRYPASHHHQGYMRFVGHAAHVTNVKFTQNDEYIVSLGGTDKSIFQWKVSHERDIQIEQDILLDQVADIPIQQDYLMNKPFEDVNTDNNSKQYQGQVKATSSNIKIDNARFNILPPSQLQLDQVFGFRTQSFDIDSLNQVKLLSEVRFVYSVGTVAIIQDTRQDVKQQKYFKLHQYEISAIELHPRSNIVATGSRAPQLQNIIVPINIWDADSQQLLCQINDFHLRAIYALQFSPDGIFLLSAGGDDEHSIALYDWQINQIVFTLKTNQSPVYSMSFRSPTEFLVCGPKTIKLFQMNGRNVKQLPLSLGQTQFEPLCCSTVAFQSKEYVTGSMKGSIFIWKDQRLLENNQHISIKAHDNGQGLMVTSLVPYSNNNQDFLLSSGLDGKIIQWAFEKPNILKKVRDLHQQDKIISLSIKAAQILIATQDAKIIKLNTSQQPPQSQVLVEGHYGGELWGLAVSPKEHKIVTCGADRVPRMWDLKSNLAIPTKSDEWFQRQFENELRAVDWSHDGNILVFGDVKGIIYLVDANTLEIRNKQPSKFSQQKATKTSWIQDIKISPDDQRVAFGAHGTSFLLEIWGLSYDRFDTTMPPINIGCSVIHLDWSQDNQYIVVNSTNYELKYISVAKGKEVQGPQVKDCKWATWTCTLGYPVQGIYRGDEYQVTSVATNNQQDSLAVGDFNGSVSLMKFPALVQHQVRREYSAHSSSVSRIAFTYDDSKVISISTLDKAIFVWKTDPTRLELEQEVGHDADEEHYGIIEKVKKYGAEKYGKIKRKDQDQEDLLEQEQQQDKNEEYTVIKPWMGQLKEPTNYYKDPLNQSKGPLLELEIDHVHGYRCKDQRNNIKFIKGGQIVYNAASLVIVSDYVNQKYFKLHQDDVIALDVSADGTKVATGDVQSIIYVWDANTQSKLCQFKGQFKRGILTLGFNTTGDRLAAIGLEDKKQIAVYDIVSKTLTGGALLFIDLIGNEQVIDLKWRSDIEFATVGINHFKIWTWNNYNLSCQKILIGKQPQTKFLCVVPFGDDYLLGSVDGALYRYKEGKLGNVRQISEGNRPLEAVNVTRDYVVVGTRDAKIALLDSKSANLQLVTQFKLGEVMKNALGMEIRSICISQDNKSLIVGNNMGEIFELVSKEARINASTKFLPGKIIVQGHFGPNRKSNNEIWGLAVNPQDSDFYYTCGDDGTLRTYSISQKKLTNIIKTNLDNQGNEIKPDESGDIIDSCKGRSIAVSTDGIQILVGFKDGSLRLFNKELKQIKILKAAKEWISDIKFSQDQSTIAVASHDCCIYLYSFPELKTKGKALKYHNSFITHIDFSQDGNYLHSTCGNYDLQFWNLQQGTVLNKGATTLRDEKWLTWSATLGWPVQGIWPEIQNQVDINVAVRSNKTYAAADRAPDNYHIIASGDDDSNIKLYRYPCVKKSSQFVLGRGHSSHITGLAWSSEDQFLISIGGEDNCIIQWRIHKLRQ